MHPEAREQLRAHSLAVADIGVFGEEEGGTGDVAAPESLGAKGVCHERSGLRV